MQIVIDIPDEMYQEIKETFKVISGSRSSKRFDYILFNAVNTGTPLPKGHGDLIDRSKIYKAIPAEEDNCTGVGMTLDEMDAYNDGIDAMYSLVHGAPTIIEADKGGEDKK